MELINKTKDYIIDNVEHLIIMALILIVIGVVLWPKAELQKDSNYFIVEDSYNSSQVSIEEEKGLFELTVDIKGQVVNPGVYTVERGANVNDLIVMAGGLRSGATTANINLSRLLSDQMVVIIYTTRELRDLNIQNITPVLNCPEVNINECKDPTSNGISIVENRPNNNLSNSTNNNNTNNIDNSNNQVEPGKISINTGTREQLMTLSGIGESRALAIIDFRNNNGPFEKIEDIMKVSGIGESIFANIKDHITV